jgi:transcriptional regulator with XRE-family HTH domain
MKTNEKTGERIKNLRKRRGLTQTQLAEKVGLKTSAFSYIELSKNRPTSELIIELSRLFGVSTDYLLTGKEDKISNDELELLEIYRLVSAKHNNDNILKKKVLDCLNSHI